MSLPDDFEKRLWAAAERVLRISTLRPSEYMIPVLGLIFLKYADHRFAEFVRQHATKSHRGGGVSKAEAKAGGVLYIPEGVRFHRLLDDIIVVGHSIDATFKTIEVENPELQYALPSGYSRLESRELMGLVRILDGIPETIEAERFALIFEYFLDGFARGASRTLGAHLTPRSVAQLVARIVDPQHGRVCDPCCGSGGMLIECARFIRDRRGEPTQEVSFNGTEVVLTVFQIAKMNLAINGLLGDVQLNDSLRALWPKESSFDFVVSCPPFNRTGYTRETQDDRRRFPFGIPTSDNANYLWIQLFYSALSHDGRAGFVMPNSAGESRGSEQEIRRQLLQTGVVDAVIALSPNLFYTMNLPVTAWFLDRGKTKTSRQDRVLFIDARGIYRKLDRRRRDLAPEQIEHISNIVRLYRGETPETTQGSEKLLEQSFPGSKYRDVPGLCKAATLKEIEGKAFSLNPGRYVGMAPAAAMRLRHMRLNNVYGFQNLDLRFPEGQVAVLIGANGAGKTTVLDSIAMFLAPLAALLRGADPRKAPYALTRTAVHVDADRAEAELRLDAGGAEEAWRLSASPTTTRPPMDPAMKAWAHRLEEALAANASASVPVLCYYPAVRFYAHEGPQKRRAKMAAPTAPQLLAYENAFEMGQQSFDGVVAWFRREEDLENEVRLGGEPAYVNPRLDGVRQAVLRFMDRLSGTGMFDDLRVRRDPDDATQARLVLRKDGKELPLDSLSDGERGCILLVADLAQRLVAANPGASDPLSGAGIVLSDEIELHLHARWQRSILPALTEIFPGCQFIVTTHSPQVLSRVPREQIVLLSRFQVVEQLPYTEGRDTNAILSELMGVPARPEEAAQEIDDLARLIDEEDLEGARRKLDELKQRFGPVDRDLLRLGAMLRALEEDEP